MVSLLTVFYLMIACVGRKVVADLDRSVQELQMENMSCLEKKNMILKERLSNLQLANLALRTKLGSLDSGGGGSPAERVAAAMRSVDPGGPRSEAYTYLKRHLEQYEPSDPDLGFARWLVVEALDSGDIYYSTVHNRWAFDEDGEFLYLLVDPQNRVFTAKCSTNARTMMSIFRRNQDLKSCNFETRTIGSSMTLDDFDKIYDI